MQISALSFSLTPAIRQHVESRFRSALSNTGISPEKATIRLLDVNGARGGVDKQCRVSVPLKSAAPVVAEATSTDLYHAVDQAAVKVRELVRRRRSRRRSSRVQRSLSRPAPVT